jgi:uncharacterized protein
MAAYRKRIVNYIRAQAQPPHKFSHQPRLYRLAVHLAEGKAFDDDVLFAAAWLHDLGVFIGHRPEDPRKLAAWDHLAYATRKIPPLLRRFGFPEAKIPAVLEVVRTHLPTARPTTFEGTLMRDADLLEQLGATAILRIASKLGRDTRFVTFSDTIAALRRNANELPSKLVLASARRQARPRVARLKAFLAAAKAEGLTGDPERSAKRQRRFYGRASGGSKFSTKS